MRAVAKKRLARVLRAVAAWRVDDVRYWLNEKADELHPPTVITIPNAVLHANMQAYAAPFGTDADADAWQQIGYIGDPRTLKFEIRGDAS